MPLSKEQKYLCSSCGKHIKTHKEAHKHPLLGTLQCAPCNSIYKLVGDLTVYRKGTDLDGKDNYCRWCLDGGDLSLCADENCHNGFCSTCIERNFGDGYLQKLSELPDWYCFVCDYTQLDKLRAESEKAIESLRPSMQVKKLQSKVIAPPTRVERPQPKEIAPPIRVEKPQPKEIDPPIRVEKHQPKEIASPIRVEKPQPKEIAPPMQVENPQSKEIAPPIQNEPPRRPKVSFKFKLFSQSKLCSKPHEVKVKSPEVIAKTPEVIAKTPDIIARAPEVIAKTPEVIAKTPKVIAKTPDVIAKAPKVVAKTPEVIGKKSGVEKSPVDNMADLAKELEISDDSGDEDVEAKQMDVVEDIETDEVLCWALRDADVFRKRLKIHIDALSRSYDTFNVNNFKKDPANFTSWLCNVETFLTGTTSIVGRCQHLQKFVTHDD